MKQINRIILIIVAILITAGVGFISLKEIEKRRIRSDVKKGALLIDQEFHQWNICEDNSPTEVTLFLRNKSESKIQGNIVFSATLSRKGLEEKFLNEFVNCYGEQRLKRELKEKMAERKNIGRLEAIYNFLMRGKQLSHGQKYELIPGKGGELVGILGSEADEILRIEAYKFKFRKKILLQPGELVRIDHPEAIPLNERGHLLDVAIEDIEF